jgi:surface protein
MRSKKRIIVANDKKHLVSLIRKEIKKNGNQCDLNHIDITKVIDMSHMFNCFFQFNGNISNWNTSNVKNMCNMFYKSEFNGDISQWDTSNVKNMKSIFNSSAFNSDVSGWDVSNVKDMLGMFSNGQFNGDISMWNVSNVEDMVGMFYNSKFNQDLTSWKPYKANIDGIFENTEIELPYWAYFKNIEDRKIVIDNYIAKKALKQKLNEELINNNTPRHLKL